MLKTCAECKKRLESFCFFKNSKTCKSCRQRTQNPTPETSPVHSPSRVPNHIASAIKSGVRNGVCKKCRKQEKNCLKSFSHVLTFPLLLVIQPLMYTFFLIGYLLENVVHAVLFLFSVLVFLNLDFERVFTKDYFEKTMRFFPKMFGYLK